MYSKNTKSSLLVYGKYNSYAFVIKSYFSIDNKTVIYEAMLRSNWAYGKQT